MRAWSYCLVLGLAAASSAQTLSTEVAGLVSSDPVIREQSFAAICARGAGALPELKRALALADEPEQLRRLGWLIARYERGEPDGSLFAALSLTADAPVRAGQLVGLRLRLSNRGDHPLRVPQPQSYFQNAGLASIALCIEGPTGRTLRCPARRPQTTRPEDKYQRRCGGCYRPEPVDPDALQELAVGASLNPLGRAEDEILSWWRAPAPGTYTLSFAWSTMSQAQKLGQPELAAFAALPEWNVLSNQLVIEVLDDGVGWPDPCIPLTDAQLVAGLELRIEGGPAARPRAVPLRDWYLVPQSWAWLAAQQRPDGSWCGQAESFATAATALAVLALSSEADPGQLPLQPRALRRGLQFLCRRAPQVEAYTLNKALALLALCSAPADGPEEVAAAAREALTSLLAIRSEGAWGWTPAEAPDIVCTAYALRALARAREAGLQVDEAELEPAFTLLAGPAGSAEALQWAPPGQRAAPVPLVPALAREALALFGRSCPSVGSLPRVREDVDPSYLSALLGSSSDLGSIRATGALVASHREADYSFEPTGLWGALCGQVGTTSECLWLLARLGRQLRAAEAQLAKSSR